MEIDLSEYAIPEDIIIRAILEYELTKHFKLGEAKINTETEKVVEMIILKALIELGYPIVDYEISVSSVDNRSLDIKITKKLRMLTISRIDNE